MARTAPFGSGTKQLRLGVRPQLWQNRADEARLQPELKKNTANLAKSNGRFVEFQVDDIVIAIDLVAQARHGLELVVDADTQYRTGRFTNFTFTAQDYQGPTWTSNAQASLIIDDGCWSITAFVRNIENNRYQTFATQTPGSNLYVSLNAAPRTFGARLSAKF